MKRVLSITILLTFLLCWLTACSTDSDNTPEPAIARRDQTSYGLDVCYIDASDDFAPEVLCVGDMGDKYCVVVREHAMAGDAQDYDSIYYISTDIDGTCRAYGGIRLAVQQGDSYIVNGDEIICLYAGNLCFMSSLDGSIIRQQQAFGAVSIGIVDNGYAVLFNDRIELYDESGELTDYVECDQELSYPSYYSPVFEQDGMIYVVVNDIQGYSYIKVNTESDEITEEISLSEFGIGYADCYGEYVFDDQGEYRIDMNDRTLTLLADWEKSVNKPADLINSYASFFPIDEESFIKVLTCVGDLSEIQIFHYEEDPVVDDRTEIVVGGYGTEYSVALNKAVYLYNMSQNEYRVVIDDYDSTATDMYGEAAIVAEMIQRLSSGDGPDILFGGNFDFNYMGRNGMLIDLSEYADDYGIYQSVSDASGNAMYCAFPGFYLSGYVGSADDPDISENMTYQQMYALGNDSAGVCSREFATDIANYIIAYSIDELVNRSNGNELLSQDVLEDIVLTSVSNGLPSGTSDFNWGAAEDPALGSYRLYHGGLFLPDSYRDMCVSCGTDLIYVGYPSLYGASHPLIPEAPMGISSGTEYPEACVDFLRFLYSDEVQSSIVEKGLIPSSADYIQKICEYSLDPDAVPADDPLASIVREWQAVPREVLDNYMRALDQCDCIRMTDWALMIIINEEIDSYETSGKTPEQIAESLGARLDLYVAENYG